MSDTQLPKALQLAENVVSSWAHGKPPEWAIQTASELRRLHAELEQARAALAAQGEPVGEVFTMEALGTPGKPFCHVLLNRTLPTGTKLYTAAPAKPMTFEERQKSFLNTPTSSGGIRTAFMLGIQVAEAHHGITDKGGA